MCVCVLFYYYGYRSNWPDCAPKIVSFCNIIIVFIILLGQKSVLLLYFHTVQITIELFFYILLSQKAHILSYYIIGPEGSYFYYISVYLYTIHIQLLGQRGRELLFISCICCDLLCCTTIVYYLKSFIMHLLIINQTLVTILF